MARAKYEKFKRSRSHMHTPTRNECDFKLIELVFYSLHTKVKIIIIIIHGMACDKWIVEFSLSISFSPLISIIHSFRAEEEENQRNKLVALSQISPIPIK